MQIILNGDEVTFAGNSLSDLIAERKYIKEHIVIELNQIVISPDEWEITSLKESDQVEVVTFVGGG